jgi:hypothetical protein
MVAIVHWTGALLMMAAMYAALCTEGRPVYLGSAR